MDRKELAPSPEAIMTEISPKLMPDTKLLIQEAQTTPSIKNAPQNYF